MSKGFLCASCAFDLIKKAAISKQVLVKAGTNIIVGTLTAIEYKPEAPRLLNMILTLQVGKNKITLAKWDTLSVLKTVEQK